MRHDRPADLGGRLLAKGFEQGGRETLMVRPVGTDDAPASPAGIDIRRVTDPAALADLVAVETEVWDDDNAWLAGALAAELAQDAQALAIYIAYAGAAPVSTGWIRFHGGRAFATLWGGSTLKAYRSRGIYRALVGIRAALARSRGAALPRRRGQRRQPADPRAQRLSRPDGHRQLLPAASRNVRAGL